MSFELFTRTRPVKGNNEMTIKFGVMAMRISKAVRKSLLNNTDYALLYFDRKKKMIGIKQSHKSNQESYKISVNNAIYSSRFMDTYGIDSGFTANVHFDKKLKMAVASTEKNGSKGEKK